MRQSSYVSWISPLCAYSLASPRTYQKNIWFTLKQICLVLKKKVELIFFPPLQLSPKPTGGDGKNFTDFRKKLDEAWVWNAYLYISIVMHPFQGFLKIKYEERGGQKWTWQDYILIIPKTVIFVKIFSRTVREVCPSKGKKKKTWYRWRRLYSSQQLGAKWSREGKQLK